MLGCEVLVYGVAVSYFILRYSIFGNPNSLGLVTGAVTTPVLLWAMIVSQGTRSYPRRVLVLILSILLLLSSYSRAGIGAAVLASVFLCLSLGRYRILAKGAAVALTGAVLVAATVPLPDTHNVHTDTLMDVFLYKGKAEAGVFGSRLSPWQQATDVIQKHPWFGSGFGTSETSVEGRQWGYAFQSMRGSIREHGNSYMALLEWVGLLGIVPFILLILLVVVNLGRVALWMRRTRSPFSPAIPIAAVVAAGMAHAIFEDWMFAPGYYMCVFFWSLAFILTDVLPRTVPVQAPAAAPYPHPSFGGSYVAASPGR
jgi:O-antigen ligase